MSQSGLDQCLIFCRTNVDCDNLEKYLIELEKEVIRVKEEITKKNDFKKNAQKFFR